MSPPARIRRVQDGARILWAMGPRESVFQTGVFVGLGNEKATKYISSSRYGL